jgi:hypothetical protein
MAGLILGWSPRTPEMQSNDAIKAEDVCLRFIFTPELWGFPGLQLVFC